jgi:hypothetical protein
VDHVVAGVEYNTTFKTKITVEGFYKRYQDYPFLLRDSITLANLGSDFGVIGNEPASSESDGRAYGAELLVQQSMTKGFFGILAYTFVRSEFKDKDGKYRPSAWDNRHIINLTFGKKFKNNWQIGAKGRFSGGSPYTPYDIATSSQISNWNVSGRGILDYDRLNSKRLSPFHGLDIRIDKEWFFDKWSIDVYLDIQNAYSFEAEQQPILDVVRDQNGNPVVDANNPGQYETKVIDNTTGNLLPTIGVIIDF